MSVVRLHVAADALAAGRAWIDGDDFHYVVRVRRLGAGDRVRVFDGEGREADAVIAEVAHAASRAALDVGAPRDAGSALRCRLAVGVALIKGDRPELAIQKLTELGAAEIVPYRAARSVVRLEGARAEARDRRYAAVARDAARQCRRATLPDVAAITSFEDVVARLSGCELRLLLWARAGDVPVRDALPAEPPRSCALLVGPEGGFTAAEVDAATAAGFLPVGLGSRVLRSETAAVAAAALVALTYGESFDSKGLGAV